MIAGCPECRARYRIDPAKLPAAGARLRCSRCRTVFHVGRPASAPARDTQPSAAPARDTRPSAAPSAPAAPRTPVAPAELPPLDVLIAHPEAELGKRSADALTGWGLATASVQDGVEAILQIQRRLPRLVVLDAALPKMFGFQVCELMKRNEQLRAIPVVLVGAIHDRERYRRPPHELYGADAYVERHELPEALGPLFERFGLPRPGPSPVRERVEPPVRERVEPPAPQRAAPMPAPAGPAGADPERDKAQRLARIIVSDVILYNPEKFEAGLRSGDVLAALGAELEEGYSLFEQRVGAGRYDAREMLQSELERQAQARKAG